MIQRKTSLSENLIAFCRFLRNYSFIIGLQEQALALEALTLINFEEKENFKDALRTTLVKNVQNLQKFDRLFDDYWKELEKSFDSKIKDSVEKKQKKQSQADATFNNLKSWMNGTKSDDEQELAAYSFGENLSEKDFSTIPKENLEEVMKIIKEMSKSLAVISNRRHLRANNHKQFDLRNTIRKNLRRGGELMEIVHKKPKKNRIKLVMLCDVSKSMDLYSAFLVQFIYAFQSVYRNIETFVFSNSIHRITNELKNKSFDEAMRELSQQIIGWSGGTQIGFSFQSFTDNYSTQMLDKQTIVLILSDGWDTGEVEILENSMEIIHQKARKIIWLNPLAGNPNFTPTAQGMSVALPFVDIFASVHNVESLRKIGKFI
jgi:uncharacterized protein